MTEESQSTSPQEQKIALLTMMINEMTQILPHYQRIGGALTVFSAVSLGIDLANNEQAAWGLLREQMLSPDMQAPVQLFRTMLEYQSQFIALIEQRLNEEMGS